MTAPARIPQAEIDRAMKVASKHGAGAVRLDYANRRIDIILGPLDLKPEPEPVEEWSDDD